MTRRVFYICLCLWLCIPLGLSAKKRASLPPPDPQETVADSLMSRVILCAPTYAKAVAAYKSNIYIKGYLHVPKRNFLLRFWPSIFRLSKGVREYMMEAYGDLRYTAPGQYDHKVTAVSGTTSDFWWMDHRLPEYFQSSSRPCRPMPPSITATASTRYGAPHTNRRIRYALCPATKASSW